MAASAAESLRPPGAASNSDGGADAGEGDRGAPHVELVLQTLALKGTCCAHCGKEGAGFKRCSICKHAWYCGPECQKAGWKTHKKTCAPKLHIDEVDQKVRAAKDISDWRGVLKWEGRMEELMEGRSDAGCNMILSVFLKAHALGLNSTASSEHALSAIRLEERRVELLSSMERFRDQSEALCNIGDTLLVLNKPQEATTYYQRARALGEAHGFFSAESAACLGLGQVARREGRHEEGLELLRNAVAAAPLNESEDSGYEVDALFHLIEALFEVRGRPQEAAREVRALLENMHENQAAVQEMLPACQQFLMYASAHLKVLAPEVGVQELIQAVADELAKVRRGYT